MSRGWCELGTLSSKRAKQFEASSVGFSGA